ncbi:DUF4276 family protein [Geitlerinema calcuttense]|uniref:DUF4276 family protein n=1 Tax=Geitlerinema calcuttense NRMC-F 0142 TaxID=2922238 RepID=A0ABT7M046_9CYAN|nr:DUF4276 family protein [Geitlerinema calcuttense]MDL5057623.1 DUF4276 family protein [Geitlerinema calcuttense NRMC-F 0142]
MIALIAEDDTDCNALRKIVHRVLGVQMKTKSWASKGCSTLRRKLAAKIQVLSNEGCTAFIILHDLDRNPQNNTLNNEQKLRDTLEKESAKIQGINKHICIPIEELEAWFWSDPEVVRYVGRGQGKATQNPHLIEKPKEELIKLSMNEKRKPRYSTNMNVELAEMLNLELCSDRCPSFKDLLNFLNSL